METTWKSETNDMNDLSAWPKNMVDKRKNVEYKWNWWKLLTIGRFNSVIGDRPFGFFATCFGFGVVFLVTGCCFRWWRWFFGCCFILITITVVDATYSYCYWITIRWHSIALLWIWEREREKNTHRYINHTHANLAFICKFVFLFLLWSNCTTGFVLIRFIYSEKKIRNGMRERKMEYTWFDVCWKHLFRLLVCIE